MPKIHVHVHTKDSVPSATLQGAKSMNEGDFKEGYKALTAAYNWLS